MSKNTQKTQKMEKPIEMQRISRIDIGDTAEESREITLSFASEEPYLRWDGSEVLLVDEKALNLSRFHDGLGCLLFNHDRDAVIGHIEKVWLDKGKAYATVTFDDDEESDKIYQKVKSGTLQGVSVGYRVYEYVFVREDTKMAGTQGDIVGPCYVATNWEALEISIVSVPADASVGVGRSLTADEFKSSENVVEVKQDMANEKKIVETEVLTEEPKVKAVDEVAVRTEAAQIERTRCANITALCRHFNVEPKEFIEKGMSLADVQAAVLSKQEAAPKATIEITKDESDKYRDAVTDALLMRAGIPVEKAAEGASEMRSMHLRALMEDTLVRAGVNHVQRMDDEELFRAALSGTSALPGILSNVANKSMAKAYDEAPTTFQYFTSIGSNVDFKEASQYRLSEAGELVEVRENGEFEHDELTESATKKKVLTFGRSFSFTRQMIINDDLGALTRIPALYAAAAKRGINRLVYAQLTNSTNYSAKLANQATAGSALSLESINAGRVAMRKQKNLRGEAMLNISPKYLIVSAENEFLARQLLTSTSDPNSSNAGVINPLMNSLQVISDAELDAIDEKAWYLAADPRFMDTIEVTYLNGRQQPTLESQVAFDTLGIRYRIYMDYGVTVLDTKGLYKNAGK